MWLSHLVVDDLRIIARAELEPGPGLNAICGPNASGKTSLLEAIFLLGRGRGLRKRQQHRLIRHGQTCLRVVGDAVRADGRVSRIGIERSGEQIQLRLDGRSLRTTAELASALPLQFIHPDIHQLLQLGPQLRRQFLDWGVFHVEPTFLACWRDYSRSLRQRNAALRAQDAVQARLWEAKLVEYGAALDALRQRYMEALRASLARTAESLVDLRGLELGYRRGWARDTGLEQALAAGRKVDLRQGFTARGPHRCDFTLSLDGTPVQECASRGQQKLILCALQMAQSALLAETTGESGLLLVDDLPAELDASNRRRFLDALRRLDAQVFVTATSADLLALDGAAGEGARVFHVEHGAVAQVV